MHNLLTESFKSREVTLVAIITEAVPVEKIFLLDSSKKRDIAKLFKSNPFLIP